jgi:hypothetical protein
MEQKADIRFLTSSESSEVVWDFPVYKLPSKTVARAVNMGAEEFEAESKLLVTNLVASFKPDVLVVDTLPQGSYREVSFLKTFARRMVYIDRHKDPSVTRTELHRKHVALYDQVLVPDHPEAAARYDHSREIVPKRKFVGPVHLFEPHESLTRTEVRERFDVRPGQRLIYLSGGGGSDSRDFLRNTVVELAENGDNFVLVGWGPLHQGELLYRRNVVSLTDASSRLLFRGVDLALSAAGYNTYQELLAARVPTVFFAQPKGMDRQDERIALGAELGWHLNLDRLDSARACELLERLAEDEVRGSILDSLEERPPARGRWSAAAEILSLHSTLSHSPINRTRLYQTVLWKREWPGGSFSDTAITARRWLKHLCHNEAREELGERAVLAWRGHGIVPAASLLRWADELGSLEPDLRAEFIRAWCHRNTGDLGHEEKARTEAASTLQILRDASVEWPKLMWEIVEGFKRPYQRQAFLLLAQRLDEQPDPPDPEEVMGSLRQEKKPWGQRELRFLQAGMTLGGNR